MKACFVRMGLSLLAPVAMMTALAAAQAKAQDQAAITGRVLDAVSKTPVIAAQVQLVGTTRGATTGDDGRFRIPGVRPGQYQVRVLRLGYHAAGKLVTVGAGATEDTEFPLSPVAVSLEDVVTTATGETARKREIGSAEQAELATAQSASQLISGHVPGVNVAVRGQNLESRRFRRRSRGLAPLDQAASHSFW